MTDDNAIVVDLSGGSVVVALCVCEEAELHVLNFQLDGERDIRLDGAEVLRENELGAGDVRLCDDAAHRYDIARAPANLLAIGQGDILGQAKVDEVVGGGQGRNLTCNRDLLSVFGEIGLDDTGVECQ